MQPTYSPLSTIFGTQTRHLVPLFQRPYVWSREEQWEPLWEDILDLANRVLAPGGKPIAGHFLGTVVLEQVYTPSGRVARREVIDGQQRLTTLQIVLQSAKHAFDEIKASQDEIAAKSAQIESARVDALITNPPGYESEEKYKVWPTNEDRAAFKQIMDAHSALDLAAANSKMSEAYRFFLDAMREWLSHAPFEQTVPALSSALKDHLRLIVLDLDSSDEPQAIFETLNAHGTPLLPADLIKNWLLWQFSRQGIDAATPYEQYWSGFDRHAGYWRQKVGTGHAARARVDTFLQNWLVSRIRQPVSTKHLYDRFLKYAGSLVDGKSPEPVHTLMGDIHDHGILYRQIDQPTERSRFATFLRRLTVLDMVVFQPVLLALMKRPGSDGQDRDAVGEMLESYLVRRMICGAQTRGYGTLAIEMIGIIHNLADETAVAPAFRTFLRGLGGALAWPGDVRFKNEWSSRVFYGYFRRNRVLMILQSLEERLQAPGAMGEPIVAFDYSRLTIEHIMPQKWREHWPLNGDEVAGTNRDRSVHGIGNLTLVSAPLNPSLSNSPWRSAGSVDGKLNNKYAALKQHTKLQMNARLLEKWSDTWDENSISERASDLFEAAREIWPGP